MVAAVASLGLLGVPAGANAADLAATPSTFASVFASAKAGDRVLLASGSYGTFSGASKSGVVTVAEQSGASASISVNFNGSSNITIDGLTITGLTVIGNAKNLTFKNSTFTGNATMRGEQLSNANILFDGNTHANINVCGSCYEGRLQIAGSGPNPSGVTIQNSTFGPGGDADGIQNGGNAVQILNNTFTGIKQISAVHTDSLQLYGAKNTVIRGNYFSDFSVAIMAPDGGSNEQITDNVFIGNGSYRPAIQMGGFKNSVFAHNVTKNLDVFMDAKSGNPPGTNNTTRDNVIISGSINSPVAKCNPCTVTHNLFTSGSSGTNAITGTPIFTGGTAPAAYAEWALKAGSPGIANASDGADRGIRVSGGTPPTPTPTPTPTPSPTPSPTPVPTPTPTPTPVPTPTPTPTPVPTPTPTPTPVRTPTPTPTPVRTPTPTPTPPAPTPTPAPPVSTPTPTPPRPQPTPTPAPPTQTAPTGLVASYGFDETSGSSVTDGSTARNNGVISGATRVAAGKHGAALRFDGTNDFVSVADAASLDLTNAMTLEAWVKPTALGSTWRTAILKEHGNGLSYALYANDDRGTSVGYARTNSEYDAKGVALPVNAWTHIAVTYDGTSLKFFVNGVQKGSRSLPGNIAAGSGPLKIGGNAVWNEWFKGDLDDVRVWRKALTASEIAADMNVDG